MSQANQSVSLSPTNPDPIASLRIWGAEVTLGGVGYKIPAVDAATWLQVLLDDPIDPERIVPGFLEPTDQSDIYMGLLDGLTSDEDFEQAFLDLLEQVSGRRWWITLRLCRVIRNNWETVGGLLSSQGVRADGVSLSYWLDGAYTTLIEAMIKAQPDKLRKVADFTEQLTRPPSSVVKAEFDEVANSNAWLAAMKMAR